MKNPTPPRAQRFSYVDLAVDATTLTGTYALDDRTFSETVTFEGTGSLDQPAVKAAARLWYLLAGLSYYKAGAAKEIDLGATPVGKRGRDLLAGALHDGLAEFAFRNDIDLSDVALTGGTPEKTYDPTADATRVLVPFGGGIDSIVTLSELNESLDAALFVVSPSSGRFQPLERAAAKSGRKVVRATRTIDPQLLREKDAWWQGHVPITAMVTALATVAALAAGRGGVVMSNEHSASVPNLFWRGRPVNHQWSKSLEAEVLFGDALEELVGPSVCVASFLRDRSEIWVAEVFSHLTSYHDVFLSCNRAFAQNPDGRLEGWCGECDKCLFINLMLAPFLSRPRLRAIFHHEPLADPARLDQLRVLVGLGATPKPFECVGDPDESAAALLRVVHRPEWADVPALGTIAAATTPPDFDDLLRPRGTSRVPAHWLR